MNDILEVAADLSINHLHGTNGVTEKIKKAMYETAKQFVYIGFLLKEVKDYKYYEEGGYEDVYAYAEFELGFKRSSTKNFIAIAETFGVQEWKYHGITQRTQSMSLQPAYEKFNYSQLVELLAMSPAQRQAAKPEMTVRELRSMKQKDREEAIRSTPPPAPMQQTSSQTSGQYNIRVHNGMSETNIGKPLIQVGLPVDNTRNASLKIETLENLCENACMKFNKNKKYHIVIYAEK